MDQATERGIERELGAIGGRLDAIDQKMDETLKQVRQTNSRVTSAEVDIAVLKDRERYHESVREHLQNIEERPRMWALAVAGPVIAAVLTVVLAHV